MLAWHVICLLTSHDHLYKLSLAELDGHIMFLYPQLVPLKPATYSFKKTVALLKNLLNSVYIAMDQRRPSDAAKCLPSNDIVVFANYCRRFYQNSTSIVFCLEPVQVNLHIMHRK